MATRGQEREVIVGNLVGGHPPDIAPPVLPIDCDDSVHAFIGRVDRVVRRVRVAVAAGQTDIREVRWMGRRARRPRTLPVLHEAPHCEDALRVHFFDHADPHQLMR